MGIFEPMMIYRKGIFRGFFWERTKSKNGVKMAHLKHLYQGDKYRQGNQGEESGEEDTFSGKDLVTIKTFGKENTVGPGGHGNKQDNNVGHDDRQW